MGGIFPVSLFLEDVWSDIFNIFLCWIIISCPFWNTWCLGASVDTCNVLVAPSLASFPHSIISIILKECIHWWAVSINPLGPPDTFLVLYYGCSCGAPLASLSGSSLVFPIICFWIFIDEAPMLSLKGSPRPLVVGIFPLYLWPSIILLICCSTFCLLVSSL